MAPLTAELIDSRERLIVEVEKRRPLWDKSLTAHKDTQLLAKLWDEIAEELGQTREFCKKLWRPMYDRFRRTYLALISESGAVNDDGNVIMQLNMDKIRWPFFQKMLFIGPYVSSRSSVTLHDGWDNNFMDITISNSHTVKAEGSDSQCHSESSDGIALESVSENVVDRSLPGSSKRLKRFASNAISRTDSEASETSRPPIATDVHQQFSAYLASLLDQYVSPEEAMSCHRLLLEVLDLFVTGNIDKLSELCPGSRLLRRTTSASEGSSRSDGT